MTIRLTVDDVRRLLEDGGYIGNVSGKMTLFSPWLVLPEHIVAGLREPGQGGRLVEQSDGLPGLGCSQTFRWVKEEDGT